MSLIDRYVAEVGRHLPEKERGDIEAEIRSTLEDMIEEKSQQTGKSMDDTNISSAIEQLGDPALLAQKYTPSNRYLIGPQWYETYVKTLKRILVTVLPIFAIVALIVALAKDPMDFIDAVGEAFGGAVDVGVQVLFWVTLVFVLLERSDTKPVESHSHKTDTWTVTQLPQLPKKRQISVIETLSNIVLVIGATAWVALPAILTRFQDSSGSAPLLHPDLWRVWLPLFFVIAGLTVIHELFKLQIGNWTFALTLTNVILGFVAIVYIIALITTQDLLNPAFLATLTESVAAEELRNLTTSAKWTINISAAIIIGIYVWDIVDSVRLSKVFEKQKTRPSYSHIEM